MRREAGVPNVGFVSPAGLAVWDSAINRMTTISSGQVRYLAVGLSDDQSAVLVRKGRMGAPKVSYATLLRIGTPFSRGADCFGWLVETERLPLGCPRACRAAWSRGPGRQRSCWNSARAARRSSLLRCEVVTRDCERAGPLPEPGVLIDNKQL